MDRLEKLKDFLKINFKGEETQIFFVENIYETVTEIIYNENGIIAKYDRFWDCLEILGLNFEEQQKISCMLNDISILI